MKMFKNIISILLLTLFLVAVGVAATLLIMSIKNNVSVAMEWKDWMQALGFVKKSTNNLLTIFGGVT